LGPTKLYPGGDADTRECLSRRYAGDHSTGQEWGGGEVASADGLRFVVPVRTLNAGPNRKYFNTDRGVTYYHFTSDQFTGFHAIVILARYETQCLSWMGCWNTKPACNPSR